MDNFERKIIQKFKDIVDREGYIEYSGKEMGWGSVIRVSKEEFYEWLEQEGYFLKGVEYI